MFDSFIVQFDKALRTLFVPSPTVREVPGAALPESLMAIPDRVHAAALMRINHVGEVCAQALYQGQGVACRDAEIKLVLAKAADEETEHLAWTERRIRELGGRKSFLNPFWYAGALSLGFAAGKLGDAWSLGFLAETERQVEAHLGQHLRALPEPDAKSRLIVEQMRVDEMAHAAMAVRLGARDLPLAAKAAMRLAARLMTRTAYYL
jgi:ubiquinone biosynthesis monooxygenase Coq7